MSFQAPKKPKALSTCTRHFNMNLGFRFRWPRTEPQLVYMGSGAEGMQPPTLQGPQGLRHMRQDPLPPLLRKPS